MKTLSKMEIKEVKCQNYSMSKQLSKLTTKKYGFAANQSAPTWKTAQQIALQTPTELNFVQPHNIAIFNIAKTKN